MRKREMSYSVSEVLELANNYVATHKHPQELYDALTALHCATQGEELPRSLRRESCCLESKLGDDFAFRYLDFVLYVYLKESLPEEVILREASAKALASLQPDPRPFWQRVLDVLDSHSDDDAVYDALLYGIRDAIRLWSCDANTERVG